MQMPVSFPKTLLRPLLILILLPLPLFPFLATASATEPGLAEDLEEKLREPFDGDLDALLKRGYLRVLVPFSKSGYFIDNGVQRGTSVDLMNEFAKFLDKKHGKKGWDGKIVLVPTSRESIFADLAEGRGDLAVGNLTITDAREKQVAFSAPLLTGVHEVPVTAATAGDIASVEDLSGHTVHVRKSSSYYESWKF